MATYAATILADSPTVWWRNNGVDASGNGNDGALGGTISSSGTGGPLTGQPSGHITVNGAGFISGALNPGLTDYYNGRTSYSVEAWAKFTKADDTVACVVGWPGGANAELGIDTGTVFFSVNDAGASAAGSGALNDGNWHHLVGVYTGSQVILYVDGLAVDTESAGAIVSTIGQVYNALGDIGGGSDDATGQFAEMALYAQALTAGRVAAHYAAQNFSPPTPGAASTARNWFLGYSD